MEAFSGLSHAHGFKTFTCAKVFPLYTVNTKGKRLLASVLYGDALTFCCLGAVVFVTGDDIENLMVILEILFEVLQHI